MSVDAQHVDTESKVGYDLLLHYHDGTNLPMRFPDGDSLADVMLAAQAYARQEVPLAKDVTRVDVIGRDGYGGRWIQARIYGQGYGINLKRRS